MIYTQDTIKIKSLINVYIYISQSPFVCSANGEQFFPQFRPKMAPKVGNTCQNTFQQEFTQSPKPQISPNSLWKQFCSDGLKNHFGPNGHEKAWMLDGYRLLSKPIWPRWDGYKSNINFLQTQKIQISQNSLLKHFCSDGLKTQLGPNGFKKASMLDGYGWL